MSAKAAVDEPLLPVAAVTRNGAWLPAVDVRELPDEYIVLADLPGLKPGDVDVTSDDNILTIAGARPTAHRRRPFPSRTANRQTPPLATTPRRLRRTRGTYPGVSTRSAYPSGAQHSQRNLRRKAGGGMRASLRARVTDGRHMAALTPSLGACPR